MRTEVPFIWVYFVPMHVKPKFTYLLTHLSLVVNYIFHLLILLLCKTWFYKECNRKCKNPVLDVIRTLGTSNQAIYYNLLNIYFSPMGVWLLPWRWHILSIPLTTGRGTGAETCRLDDVFPPDALCSRPEALCQYMYVYIYIYALLYEFCFLWFTNCVLLSGDYSLIPGCLWPLTFVLNNTLILGLWCSTIPQLPGCFWPWTFLQNIGFNMATSDPFMSHVATQLGYSAGEFQALQLIVLATFGVVD